MLLLLSQKLQDSISLKYIADNVGKKGSLTFFKIRNVYKILKFSSLDNVAEDLLSIHFTNVVLLRIQPDGNFL